MDFVKPAEVLQSMVDAGENKARMNRVQMLIRGFLAGAILAFATTLAYTAVSQTSVGLAGALIFPAGFVIIILLGLELVTGSFAMIPLAVMTRRVILMDMLRNYFWVIAGHILGCLFYALLYELTLTKMGTDMSSPLVQTLIQTSEAKTLGYQHLGGAGIVLVIIKAILCNWMVTLGAVMAMTSTSTLGKIVAMWLPITIFFAQGFEHAVVNMFVIPAGIMLGADVSIADWWLWNQIPVLFGNFIGGALFTGLGLYAAHRWGSPIPMASKLATIHGGRSGLANAESASKLGTRS
ncbi:MULTISPECIES: formate/nitrite transporter family protein [Paenibacillus]|uniref:formate/nitrite transporter family protein n=1 Tax=Paenibacillus TaxID=44249 RepID=UPI00203CF028|nr:formate/nitrite transporter family protein [Paenibacillus illinoisensis]MCM3206679.1 formate/nitrite transporter family protein [Paenibacillus illinoisensis]